MSRLLKYKPEFSKEELHSFEKAFKLFADRNGMMNLNNMAIAMKELKFDESEPVVYDLITEIEAETKNGITYDDGTAISDAVGSLVRAVKVGRRV